MIGLALALALHAVLVGTTLPLDARLHLQHALAVESDRTEIRVRHDPSDQAERLRTAIAEIRAGIEGDPELLLQAQATLDGAEPPPRPVVASIIAPGAMSRDITAFRAARIAGDAERALALQGRLLNAAAALELAFRYVPTGEAHRAQAAVTALQVGLDGDDASLDSATNLLRSLNGA
jgi:hypothetical protein